MNHLLQISSGRGPAECAWVVAQVLRIMLEEARNMGVEACALHREQGSENGTLLSAIVQIKGENISTFVESWAGSIQWIGQSPYRKMHRRKNWFVAVNSVELDESSFEINMNDVKFQAIRSGGPGGQHVNKVSTAIRATHLPTGISVTSSESRSQLQNKKTATDRLIMALETHFLEERIEQAKSRWEQHNEVLRGNPVRIFRGSDFKPKTESKGFKSKRTALKNDLKKELLSDD